MSTGFDHPFPLPGGRTCPQTRAPRIYGDSIITVPQSLNGQYRPSARTSAISISPAALGEGATPQGLVIGAANLCTGAQIYNTIVDGVISFRTLAAGSGVTILTDEPSSGCIEISATGTSGISGGANLGTGSNVFSSVVGSTMNFRSLVAGTGITVTQDSPATGDIQIAATSSGISGGANLGTGADVFSSVVGSTMNFRSLVAGAGITITQDSPAVGDVQIASSGVLSGANLGTGADVFSSIVGSTMNFRSLVAGAGITITQDSPATGDVQIAALGAAIPTNLLLYVNGATGSDSNSGTALLPFATLQRAVQQVQLQGYNNFAAITIQQSTPPLSLPIGEINISSGSIGSQTSPLVIQGAARTLVASGTIVDGGVEVDTNGNGNGSSLLTIIPTSGSLPGVTVGMIVRFTSGTLSTYTGAKGPLGTQQVEAFIGSINAPNSALTLAWAVPTATGGGNPALPAAGDTFVVESITTQVIVPVAAISVQPPLPAIQGTTLVGGGAQTVLYNLAFTTANIVAASAGVLTLSGLALTMNAVQFVPGTNTTLQVTTVGGSLTASSFGYSFPNGADLGTLPTAAPNSTAGVCSIATAAKSAFRMSGPITSGNLSFSSSGVQAAAVNSPATQWLLANCVMLGNSTLTGLFALYGLYMNGLGTDSAQVTLYGATLLYAWVVDGGNPSSPEDSGAVVCYGAGCVAEQLHVTSPLENAILVEQGSATNLFNANLAASASVTGVLLDGLQNSSNPVAVLGNSTFTAFSMDIGSGTLADAPSGFAILVQGSNLFLGSCNILGAAGATGAGISANGGGSVTLFGSNQIVASAGEALVGNAGVAIAITGQSTFGNMAGAKTPLVVLNDGVSLSAVSPGGAWTNSGENSILSANLNCRVTLDSIAFTNNGTGSTDSIAFSNNTSASMNLCTLNNNVRGNSVSVSNGSTLSALGNNITGNALSGSGILVTNGGALTCSGTSANTIVNHGTGGTTTPGVLVQLGSAASFVASGSISVTGSGGPGMQVALNSSLTVNSAVLFSNNGDGISIQSGSRANIGLVSGTSTGAGSYGVHIGVTGSSIAGNGCQMTFSSTAPPTVTGTSGNFAAETTPTTTSTWAALGTGNDYTTAAPNTRNIAWSKSS
jgi:hypothetical protein